MKDMEEIQKRIEVLKKKLANISATMSNTKETQNYYADLYKTQKAEMEGIRQEIYRLEARSTPISDHALIRFLERVRGLDVEALRKEIGGLTQNSKKIDYTTGRHTIEYEGKEYEIVLKNGVFVSIF